MSCFMPLEVSTSVKETQFSGLMDPSWAWLTPQGCHKAGVATLFSNLGCYGYLLEKKETNQSDAARACTFCLRKASKWPAKSSFSRVYAVYILEFRNKSRPCKPLGMSPSIHKYPLSFCKASRTLTPCFGCDRAAKVSARAGSGTSWASPMASFNSELKSLASQDNSSPEALGFGFGRGYFPRLQWIQSSNPTRPCLRVMTRIIDLYQLLATLVGPVTSNATARATLAS